MSLSLQQTNKYAYRLFHVGAMAEIAAMDSLFLPTIFTWTSQSLQDDKKAHPFQRGIDHTYHSTYAIDLGRKLKK